MLDAAFLRSLLMYDGETGYFVWLVGKTQGKRAGCMMKDGYRAITIERRQHYEHRLVWLYEHGVWPTSQLDHRNGVRDDNRIENLREATAAENAQNRTAYRTNRSGYQGVSLIKGRFLAQIKAGPKHLQLGWFDDAASAHRAYLMAKAELHYYQPTPRTA